MLKIYESFEELKDIVSKEKLSALIAEVCEFYTNDKGCFEYGWDDYEDVIPESEMLKYITKCKEDGFIPLQEWLTDYEDIYYLCRLDNYFDDVRNAIENDISNAIENKFHVAVGDEFMDFVREEYLYTYPEDMNLEKLIDKSTFNINLLLATPNEANFDLGSIRIMHESMDENCGEPLDSCLSFDADDDYLYADNGFSWLVYQQGYNLKQIYDKNCDDKFANKMHDFVLGSYYGGQVCFAVKANARDIQNILSCEKIHISKRVNVDIVDTWNGSTSDAYSPTLVKDVVLPTSLIQDIQVEGTKNFHYTLNDICGFIDSYWWNCELYPDPTPTIMDMSETSYVEDLEEANKQRITEIEEEKKGLEKLSQKQDAVVEPESNTNHQKEEVL